jgi:8-amino-7-oxononanoate synthase
VLDFTSALYLGLQHPSHSLRPWQKLTTGAPAALVEAVEAREISQALAELQGCEAATLGTSTFHLAWDLFGLLAKTPINLFMDAGVYPITRWGVQRAAMLGATVRAFPHHDVSALERDLAETPRGRKPVIVTDGFCPRCGRVAPLVSYISLARRCGGLLVTDDTQALGVLGHSPSARRSYGCGGGGALRWGGIRSPETLVISSLAKGFGSPVAVLAGSRFWVGKFEEQSLTRVHCSPPSIAVLRAAEHALKRNRIDGDARRDRLVQLVHRFRRGVKAAGVALTPGLFPAQAIESAPGLPLATLHQRLLERGILTALSRGENGRPQISFLLTARHTPEEIDTAVSAIIAVLADQETSTKVNYEQLRYQ